MSRAIVGVVVLAACGGRPATPPPPVQSVPLAVPSTEPTCEDMGPLLRRGLTSDSGEEDADADEDAGTKIVAACVRQQWSVEVLACVADANETDAPACLELLPEEQRAALRDEVGLGGGDAEEDEELGYTAMGYTCGDLDAEALGRWEPPLTDDKPDGLGGKLRRSNLVRACYGWSDGALGCIVTGGDEVDDCLQNLSPDERDEITAALDTAERQRVKILAALKKPATITCTKVAAARYPEATWKARRPSETAAQRKKTLAAERSRLAKECTARAWPAEVRACIVLENHDDCFEIGSLDSELWQLPIQPSPPPPSGIAECDDYGKVIWAVGTCEKLPIKSRNVLMETFLEAVPAWKNLTGDALQSARDACRTGADSLRNLAVGC